MKTGCNLLLKLLSYQILKYFSRYSLLGKEAFSLIINNPVRTFVLNKMVDFLLFVGKVVIVVGSGVTSYFAFSGWFPELASQIPTLNYFFTPILFITIGTYFITSSFFSVYAMAVDTIFLSFLQDLKQNDGSPQKPYIMEKGNFYPYSRTHVDV